MWLNPAIVDTQQIAMYCTNRDNIVSYDVEKLYSGMVQWAIPITYGLQMLLSLAYSIVLLHTLTFNFRLGYYNSYSLFCCFKQVILIYSWLIIDVDVSYEICSYHEAFLLSYYANRKRSQYIYFFYQ